MCAIPGWLSDASTCASRLKRARRSASAATAGRSTLIATSRCNFASRARYTSPIPPAPICGPTSYAPSRCPESDDGLDIEDVILHGRSPDGSLDCRRVADGRDGAVAREPGRCDRCDRSRRNGGAAHPRHGRRRDSPRRHRQVTGLRSRQRRAQRRRHAANDFSSGSLGKQFTATAIMLQLQDGKLSLSDPLAKFFPGPDTWRTITVRHLLTHTSGIPDYNDGQLDYRKDYTEDELVKFAGTLTLDFAPGAEWKYSNTGYILLGAIVRKVSGSFYGDVLRDRVFTPLGMTTARVISEADIVPHRAAGYRLERGELRNQQWVSPAMNTTADGSLYLSLQDLIAWDRGLRSGAILSADNWRQIFTPVTLNSGRVHPYGFGFEVDRVAGRTIQKHGGAWQGFKTYIARYG